MSLNSYSNFFSLYISEKMKKETLRISDTHRKEGTQGQGQTQFTLGAHVYHSPKLNTHS